MKTEIDMTEIVGDKRYFQLGFVRHFKGGQYVVLGQAKHADTGEIFVVYSDGWQKYIRPFKNFMSEVDKNKYPDVKQKYRFEFLPVNFGAGD